jgi:hypothetical protein
MIDYRKNPLWKRIQACLEHLEHDADYFEKGIAHHKEVAEETKSEISKAGSNAELKKELENRLADTLEDISRMETELSKVKKMECSAEAIPESAKGQPPIGKTPKVMDPDKPLKPQPRYLLKNKPVGKTKSKPAGK